MDEVKGSFRPRCFTPPAAMSTIPLLQACLRRASARAPGARCAESLPPPLLIRRLWTLDGLAKIDEELLKPPDRTLVALDLPLPATSNGILDQFAFNAPASAEPRCICGRRHALGAGKIEIASTRSSLRRTETGAEL